MVPISDNLHPRRFPYVTWALIGLNAAVFLWQLGLPEWVLERVFLLHGIVPARLTNPTWAWYQGFPGWGWLTLFTSMFLHGGWLHILANVWTLRLFGDDVEDRLGPARFLGLYFLTGALAGYVHVSLFPGSAIPTIGASGAISGIMGAYFYLFPRAKIDLLVPVFFFLAYWQVPAALYLPFWFMTQLFSGTLALASSAFGGVAFWAHIGGFAAGLALIPLFLQEPQTDRGSSGSSPWPFRAAEHPRQVFPDEVIQGARVYVVRRR